MSEPGPGPVARTGAVRWGLVGCGWVARDFVAPALDAAPSARLVAVHDTDPAAARLLASGRPQPVAQASTTGALLDGGVDAVYVATPNAAHRPVVEACATAGLPVLVEKPLAADAADASALVSACEAAGVRLGTAFDQRHHPAHRALAGLVAAGELGTVHTVRVVYGCWLPPAWSPDGRQHDNWRADPARAGGGAGMDLAPHGLDLAQVLLAERLGTLCALPRRRVHDYAVDDGCLLAGATSAGTLVSLHVSYATPDALPRRRLEVVGTAGQAVATDTMGQTAGGRLSVHDATDGRVREVPFDASASPFSAQVEAFSRAVVADAAGDAAGADAAWPWTAADDLATHRLLVDALRAGQGSADGRGRGGPDGSTA